MEEIPVEQLVKKGTMIKSPFLMTTEERAEWQVLIQANKGLFIFYWPTIGLCTGWSNDCRICQRED